VVLKFPGTHTPGVVVLIELMNLNLVNLLSELEYTPGADRLPQLHLCVRV
jgi:hypothetical protein